MMAVAVAADSKDASAIMVTTPVRRGGWRRRKDSKDASNRGNATGNNQPAQQKDERLCSVFKMSFSTILKRLICVWVRSCDEQEGVVRERPNTEARG